MLQVGFGTKGEKFKFRSKIVIYCWRWKLKKQKMTVHDPPLTFAKKSILIRSFILSFFVAKKTFLLKGLRMSLCFLRCWAGVVWAILLMLSLSEIGAQINTDGSTCCVQSERNV